MVEGVRKGIRVEGDEIELHPVAALGRLDPGGRRGGAAHVADYLERMADARPAAVNVVVEEVDGAA